MKKLALTKQRLIKEGKSIRNTLKTNTLITKPISRDEIKQPKDFMIRIKLR